MKNLVWCVFAVVCLVLLHGNAFSGDRGRSGTENPKDLWVYKQSVSLGVKEDELESLVADCRARGIATVEVQRMLGLVARAKLAGLPHRDLLAKLREGLAKNASPELIDAALAGKAQTLKRAKGIVDSLIVDGYAAKDYEMAIQLVGDALEAGVSPQGVLSLIREGGRPPQGLPDPGSMFLQINERAK